jgi:DNA/RNA endonuclease YhcR with UshA esterase domain
MLNWPKQIDCDGDYIMRPLRVPVLLCVFAIISLSVPAQTKTIAAAEAKNHIGESATVCGKVVSSRYADRSKGAPTFLNLDEPFPKQIFTIVVWGDNRPKFGEPENKYTDKRICVTGKITSYRGSPEIVATDPKDIEIQK